MGLGGPLGLELLDGVECLVESESGCEDEGDGMESRCPGHAQRRVCAPTRALTGQEWPLPPSLREHTLVLTLAGEIINQNPINDLE